MLAKIYSLKTLILEKNKLHILCFLLISLISSAQPILISSDYTDISAIGYQVTNGSSLNPGSSGPNAYWDFSSATFLPNPFYTINTVPIDSAPFYLSFPTANYCRKVYVLSGAYESYSIEKLENFGLEMLGITTPEIIQHDYFLDTRFTPLPLTYNTTYSDTYQNNGNSPETEISTYDSYGTLVTPFGTFNNVMRIKSVKGTTTSYSWFKTNPFQSLMAGEFSNTENSNLYIYQNGLLDIKENLVVKNLIIYPNPSNGEFSISSSVQLNEIKITDLLGKELSVVTPSDLTTNIKLTNYKAGIYFVKMSSYNQEVVKKIFIK